MKSTELKLRRRPCFQAIRRRIGVVRRKERFSMNDQPALNCLKLAALPNAAGLGRRHAMQLLERWHCGELADAVELVASELVTNAVRATGILETEPSWGVLRQRLHLICLCLYQYRGGVVVEVWDREKQPPMRGRADASDESGRGLELIDALCEQWGYRWPVTGGKWVWGLISGRRH